MELPSITPEDAIKVLNEALEIDCDAIKALIEYRVLCNEKLADHPSIQVRAYDPEGLKVGLLGIINGLFGSDKETGYGYIAIDGDFKMGNDGKIVVKKINKFHLTDFSLVQKKG